MGIATYKSSNRKTGNMIQTWIQRSHIDPVRAVSTGRDRSICGNCYHRGDANRPRTCYVNVGQAPYSIYNAAKRGVYPSGSLAELPAGRPVRFGAYGDPVAIPFHVWQQAKLPAKWTGYTHQWRQDYAQPFKKLLMASCDSPADMAEAASMGWRAFVVTAHDFDGKVSDAILCPSVSHGVQCADCGLCRGASVSAPSVYIPAHGTAKAFV